MGKKLRQNENENKRKGILYLVPCPISDEGLSSIPESVKIVVKNTRHFVVERLRTARRFIKSVDLSIEIDELKFYELVKHGEDQEKFDFLDNLQRGYDVGVISEAGNPAIADPGNNVVAWCHQNGIRVVPLAGPSAILMALISSGFNGQNFSFNGYLPHDKKGLTIRLKALESLLNSSGQTQLFMETPYRNGAIIKSCIEVLNVNTKLLVACDLDSSSEDVKVKTIGQWKKIDLGIYHKRPAVFGIGK